MKLVMKLLSIASACFLSAACSSGTDNTLKPSALVPFKPTMRVSTVWETSVGNGAGGYYLRLHPAASEGVVYTDSQNGEIEALNANTGQTIWAVNTGMPLTSGVSVGNGNVYVGTGNASVLALSAQTGKMVWHSAVNSEVWAAPLYAQGLVLVHTISGNLSALSAQTGKRIWRYDEAVPSLILHAASQPQVAGNQVIAGFANGSLVVLNLQTGNAVWKKQIAVAVGTSIIQQMIDITVNPVVVDGIVYVATYQGRISALSMDNGQLIWSHKISSFAGMTADSSHIYVTDADSRVWAFDESTGAVTWRQNKLLGRQVTGPTIYANSVVVADRYGFLNFMSKSDGHFIARVNLGDGALAQPVAYNKMLYVATSSGDLIALRAGK